MFEIHIAIYGWSSRIWMLLEHCSWWTCWQKVSMQANDKYNTISMNLFAHFVQWPGYRSSWVFNSHQRVIQFLWNISRGILYWGKYIYSDFCCASFNFRQLHHHTLMLLINVLETETRSLETTLVWIIIFPWFNVHQPPKSTMLLLPFVPVKHARTVWEATWITW